MLFQEYVHGITRYNYSPGNYNPFWKIFKIIILGSKLILDLLWTPTWSNAIGKLINKPHRYYALGYERNLKAVLAWLESEDLENSL